MLMFVLLATVSADADPVLWFLAQAKEGVDAFQRKDYLPAVGVAIMLLVFVLKRTPVLSWVSPRRLPLASAILGVIAAVGTNLAGLAMGYQTMDWMSALGTGLFCGAGASGFWSLLGKEVLPSAGSSGSGAPPPAVSLAPPGQP